MHINRLITGIFDRTPYAVSLEFDHLDGVQVVVHDECEEDPQVGIYVDPRQDGSWRIYQSRTPASRVRLEVLLTAFRDQGITS